MAEAKPCCWWEEVETTQKQCWTTQCGNVLNHPLEGFIPNKYGFEYCPFCGGEIVILGDTAPAVP